MYIRTVVFEFTLHSFLLFAYLLAPIQDNFSLFFSAVIYGLVHYYLNRFNLTWWIENIYIITILKMFPLIVTYIIIRSIFNFTHKLILILIANCRIFRNEKRFALKMILVFSFFFFFNQNEYEITCLSYITQKNRDKHFFF